MVEKIKVLLISDIHGNIAALDAVLEDTKNEKIDVTIALGDLCNELPNGNDVINKLKGINAYAIKGNKEEYFLNFEKYKYTWTNLQFKNTKFMYNELSEESKEYIRKLPFSLSFNFEGVKIKAVHGSPESIYELVRSYNEDQLEKYTKSLEEDILFLGHTHDPIWIDNRNGKTIVNCGTVGVSVFDIGQAEYVILNIEKGKYTIESRKANYDLNKLKENIKKSGILDVERTFENLVYLALTGGQATRKWFYTTGKEMMAQSGRKLYRDDAEGIYKSFKLLDDDIWIELTKKVENQFLL